MVERTPVTQRAADYLARVALRFPLVERVLVAATRRPLLRRCLRLGAIALGYPRVLGRRELRIAAMDGYRFHVNVGESLGVEPYFFGQPGTAWLTRSLLRPGDLCVDAGANVGHYTFQCASIVGLRGHVFAFEPNPEFASLLKRSIALNGFERIVDVSTRALWSSTGETKKFYLSVEPTNTGTSSLVEHGWFLSPDHTIDVETVRFDDFASQVGVNHFRLVKLDVERAEDSVLEGARRTLADGCIDYLIIEMHAGGRAQDLLLAAGYAGHFLNQERRELVPLAQIPQDHFGDYLFFRSETSPPES
jgi:FkbM family methyltransferase